MSGFIISRKLTPAEADAAIADITRWFEANPKRRVCRTDLGWRVRRGHVAVDVGLHTMREKPERA